MLRERSFVYCSHPTTGLAQKHYKLGLKQIVQHDTEKWTEAEKSDDSHCYRRPRITDNTSAEKGLLCAKTWLPAGSALLRSNGIRGYDLNNEIDKRGRQMSNQEQSSRAGRHLPCSTDGHLRWRRASFSKDKQIN